MIWLKLKDLDIIEKLFQAATHAGDSLIAGELFDVIVEVVHSAGRANENPALTQLQKMQWERVAVDAKARLESILKDPTLHLESQLILGRKVLPIAKALLPAEEKNVDGEPSSI